MAASKFFSSIELLFIKFFVGTIILCVAYKPQTLGESVNSFKGIEMSTKQIFSTNFEVFGKVQGKYQWIKLLDYFYYLPITYIFIF